MYRTTAATKAVQRYGAERAARDPKKLSRSVRIVATAVELETLTADELADALVDRMPPLTDAQCARLRDIFLPVLGSSTVDSADPPASEAVAA